MKIGEPFNPWNIFCGIWIPFCIVQCEDLSTGAKICFGRLLYHAGKDGHCFVSQRELGKELAVSPRQVRRYLDELVNLKLLKTESTEDRYFKYYFLGHKMYETAPLKRTKRPHQEDKKAPSNGADMSPSSLYIREVNTRSKNKKQKDPYDKNTQPFATSWK